jgi:hypothetical protein
MNAHQSYANNFGEWQSRSQCEWDGNDWEYEGKYMELEKLLREGEGQHFSKQRKLEQSRHEDAEREPYYERVEGNGLQHENRGGAFQDAGEKTRDHADSQMENTQGRATDWQDFGDYEPGYSGHQISRQRRGGIFSGSDSKGESGSRTLRGRTAKKAGIRKQRQRSKPLRGRAAKSSRPSRRR